jgi:hypothetical protein
VPEIKTPIRTFALIANAWVAIPTPVACNYWALLKVSNNSPIWRSSDPNNPNSQYELNAYETHALVVPGLPVSPAYRFAVGDTVAWLMATVASTNVIIEFIP